ncbi:unnamed protein product [Dovyalis caffra]|uniref:F-box domain-containing protein n=1 Tax=Dovyalis caffra TaxID=77055 RepID=A0AAV1QW35_9ROSI|nr:unnamed protein product [Dovyalis caffra]
MVQSVGQERQTTTQCINTDQRWDRFSDLPEPIIHHIFSFLEMNDIARIGAVSRRCRQMFICSPYLKFKLTCSYDGPPNLCKQFSDHVDRLLSQRNGLEIRCLCLHWACFKDNCDVDVTLIDRWVNVALSCQAQEIDLEVGLTECPFLELEEIPIFELPKCVFSSETLRVLKLDLHHKCLKEPTGAFVLLEDLTLTTMAGPDSERSLKKLISTACPSLKRLTIVNLDDVRHLSVISPSLEELTLIDLPYNLWVIDISTQGLQKLYLDLHSLFAGYLCTMKIDAPNLQDLKWKAATANNIYLSQFRFLKNANISVGISDSYVDEPTTRNRITDLLQGVCCSRTLQLNSDVLEELKLKALEDYKQHGGFHNLICHQLNAIEIELNGKGHKVGFLKNMCKVAKGLKKMTIFYSKESYNSLSEIGLHNSRLASQPFEVNLVEK